MFLATYWRKKICEKSVLLSVLLTLYHIYAHKIVSVPSSRAKQLDCSEFVT